MYLLPYFVITKTLIPDNFIAIQSGDLMNHFLKKRVLILSLAVIVQITCLQKASAQNSSTDAIDTLSFNHMTELWREAYNSKDAANLIPFYTDAAEYISPYVQGLVKKGVTMLS